MDELQNTAGLGFDDGFHDQLPTAIQDGDHNRFLVHVHADILDVATHCSCLLGGKVIRANAYLSLKVTCHSPADLPMPSATFFLPHTPRQLLSSRRSGAKPCTAQRSGGGTTSALRPSEAGRSFIMHCPRDPKN